MRADSHLDVALGNKSPHMHWVALVAPWGQEVERNLQMMPWVVGTWPPILKMAYPGPADHKMLLRGTFVISLWPIMNSPMLLQVDAEPPVRHERSGIRSQEGPLCQPLSYWLARNLPVYCLRVMICHHWCL